MAHPSQIRQHPFRWLAKAALLGATVGCAVATILGGLVPFGLRSVGIGIIFSLVMWGGFDLLERPPARLQAVRNPALVGLATLGWTLGCCLLLLALSLALVRLLLGIDLTGNAFVLTTSVLAGLAVSGFMGLKETVTQKVQTERRLAQAEARAAFLGLQAQLQPHTLFNALNTIASLIHDDPDRAEEATERLAELLRRVLGALERPEWPLGDEFALIEHLLRLEQLRFGARLSFELQLEPAMAERPVQPLLLLPLVENALKHGFRPKVGACHLQVVAANGAVTVRDDGVGRAPDAPEGLGLRTVRERLAAAGGGLCWLDRGPGCTVEVRLG